MDSQNEADEAPDHDVLTHVVDSNITSASISLKSPNQSHIKISCNDTTAVTAPNHHGRQKSFMSLATELTHYTRISSRKSAPSNLSNSTIESAQYSRIASVVSAYSSFIPQENEDLLQIEYIFGEQKANKRDRAIYIVNISLFIIFYILLFIEQTAQVARYLVLVMSLSLSLIYTMKPSYLNIPIPCLCQNTTQETIIITVSKFKFPLDQSTVPIICVLLLIANFKDDTYFTLKVAWNCMIGIGEIKPWAVLGVLFGLCYLCITLDLTGILKGLAKKTADASDSYQTRLFLYMFLFAAILTIITNNDISIICLTPLVCSTANAARIDATPFIFMVLFTSNTFSMLLITGNPANLIVSEAANLSYIKYLKYMLLPTIITGIVLYGELYIMFKKKLQKRFQAKMEVETWKNLVKLPRYAVFCGVRLFLACIGIPIVGQLQENNTKLKNYPLDMFIVLGIALISLLIDFMLFDIRLLAQFSSIPSHNQINQYDIIDMRQQKLQNTQNSLIAIDETQEDEIPYVELSGMPSTLNTFNTLNTLNTLNTRVTHDTFQTYDSNALLYHKLKLKIETFAVDALWELPWKLIPFVFGLFIIVGFMKKIGLVDFLADMLIKISTNEWIAMFVVGFIATLLCQMVNNQPMTVLISTVLDTVGHKYPNEYPNEKYGPSWLTGAYFALAIGANLGGNATPIASLAVLMWRGILEKWNIHMQYAGFSKRGILVTPLLVALCIFIVAIEEIFLFK